MLCLFKILILFRNFNSFCSLNHLKNNYFSTENHKSINVMGFSVRDCVVCWYEDCSNLTDGCHKDPARNQYKHPIADNANRKSENNFTFSGRLLIVCWYRLLIKYSKSWIYFPELGWVIYYSSLYILFGWKCHISELYIPGNDDNCESFGKLALQLFYNILWKSLPAAAGNKPSLNSTIIIVLCVAVMYKSSFRTICKGTVQFQKPLCIYTTSIPPS